MSILTKEEILKEIEKKALVITPFSKDQVGPASVDLHLGPEFRMFKKVHQTFIVDDAASSEKELTERTIVKQGNHYLLTPGETVLAVTRERIKLPPYLCGWLEGRGRFARLGLDIRIGAGFVQPGTDNQVFFTITNQGPAVLEIYPGTRICQLILQRTVGEAVYEGKFKRVK